MPTKVDDNQCIGCKKCYNLCPLDVFTWQEEIKKPIFVLNFNNYFL